MCMGDIRVVIYHHTYRQSTFFLFNLFELIYLDHLIGKESKISIFPPIAQTSCSSVLTYMSLLLSSFEGLGFSTDSGRDGNEETC